MTALAAAAPRGGAAPRAATTTVVAAWGLGVCSLLLIVGARPALDENLLFYAVDLAVAGVYGGVAALVLSRRRHVVASLLAVAAVGGGLAGFGYAYASLALRLDGLPAAELVGRLSGTAWLPGTFALFLVVPWLVRDDDDPPLTTSARWGLGAGIALTLSLTTVAAVPQPNPTLDALRMVLTGVAVLVGLLAAADCLSRRWHTPDARGAGLGWLALGTAMIAVSFVPIAWPPLFAVVPLATVPALHLLSQAVFPAAVLVVVLRRRMWGLDIAVSRAVLAGTLTALLAVAYVAVTAVVSTAVPGSGIAQVAAAAVVVAAVQPSRLWLHRRVNRLVYGESSDPAVAVRRLGVHLGSAATTEDLLEGLVDAVAAALRLDGVELVLDDRVVVSRGRVDADDAVAVPLRHRGATLGRLLVSTPGGERLDARARTALDELAGVVAAGAALTVATADLEEARDRLTSARMAERRMIRRELHDGLGPSLAGLRLGLEGARNIVRDDPERARELMAALQAELEQRVQDVRTLSRDLLPPVLDELGVGAALEELAVRHRSGGFDVRVDCDLPTAPSPQLAGALYGIAVEAVTNAARHSGAGGCDVSVHREGEQVRLVVADDGRGIGGEAVAGVGTSSMRERAEEAGGTLTVRGPGTVVEAVLPWRS